MTVKILAFAGSLRKDSYNKKLAKIIAKSAEKAGAEVTLVELNDYPMPLFNEDDESKDGIHPNALKFKQLMNESDGFLIASPEYNGAYSGVLKNVVDWASRQADGEGMLESFKGKYATLFATSPGAFGGLRGLNHLRILLSGIGTTVTADQVAIPKAQDAITDDGQLASEKRQASVDRITKNLVDTLAKLKA